MGTDNVKGRSPRSKVLVIEMNLKHTELEIHDDYTNIPDVVTENTININGSEVTNNRDLVDTLLLGDTLK